MVSQYVRSVYENAFTNWNSLTGVDRGEAMINAAADVLVACGVPRPTPDVRLWLRVMAGSSTFSHGVSRCYQWVEATRRDQSLAG